MERTTATSLRSIASVLVLLAAGVSVAVQADAAPVYYSTRSAFLANVGSSITDDFTGYGGSGSPAQLTDAQMTAVRGETRFEALTFPNANLVGDVYAFDDGNAYCAGCNGEFRLWFDSTSLTQGQGVGGVAFDVLLHTSRRSSLGDALPGDTGLPGTLLVEFGNGATEFVTIPADVGFFGADPYFFGITDPRGIRSIRVGSDSPRHTWVIDNLTIGARPVAVPEPDTPVLALTLAVAGFLARVFRDRQSRIHRPTPSP